MRRLTCGQAPLGDGKQLPVAHGSPGLSHFCIRDDSGAAVASEETDVVQDHGVAAGPDFVLPAVPFEQVTWPGQHLGDLGIRESVGRFHIDDSNQAVGEG
jgi:hypothetical protein